jgi:acyl carrier protein
MERQQVLVRLKALVKQQILQDESVQVDETTPLLELGVLDSFVVLSLLALIEAEFSIEIPLETLTLGQLEDLNSIADLIVKLNPV